MLVCPYTPQHNGIIERVWQTLMSATVALLLTAGLGEECWQEAFGCAVHVYNGMTCAHPTKYPKSPFEALTKGSQLDAYLDNPYVDTTPLSPASLSLTYASTQTQ